MRICARWESAMPVEARDVVGGARAVAAFYGQEVREQEFGAAQ